MRALEPEDERQRIAPVAEGTLASAGAIGAHEALSIFRRQKWLIAVIVLLGTGGAAWFGLIRTPVYTATAEMIIAPQRSELVDPEARGTTLDPRPAEIATQMTIIRSKDFLREVVGNLRLQDNAEFVRALEQPRPSIVGALERLWRALARHLPDSWMIGAGLADEEPPSSSQPEALADYRWPDHAIARIAEKLNVWQVSESYTIRVSYTSPDPRLAAQVATETARHFVERRRDVKLHALQQGADWLAGQVEELRKQVLQAEQAVENFKANNGLIAEDGNPEEIQLSDLHIDAISSHAELADKKTTYKQLLDMRTRGEGINVIMQLMPSPELDELRSREAAISQEEADLRTVFGPKHPRWLALQSEESRLQERIGATIDRIMQGLEEEIRIMTARERAILDRIDEVQEEVAGQRQKVIELRELERTAATIREQYLDMLRRQKRMREPDGIVESDAQLVEQPSAPDTPSSGGAPTFALVGFTASCMIGTLIALLRDRLDRTFRTPAQIARMLGGLPTLGVVPQKKGRKLYRHVAPQARSDYGEAIRNIYTRLRLVEIDDDSSRVVLITSAVPSEGKTTLAGSLAAFAATSAQRVMLVDLDLRRPNVHRMLGKQRAAPGIVELLAEGRPLEEGTRRHEESGIDYLPGHRLPVNPTALLASRKMQAALASLRARYDLVVIDTPPLLAAADATVLCSLVDQVVLAVRWGQTDRVAVAGALERLHQVGANVVGIVLTRTIMRKYIKYDYHGYGKYYRKYKAYYA